MNTVYVVYHHCYFEYYKIIIIYYFVLFNFIYINV